MAGPVEQPGGRGQRRGDHARVDLAEVYEPAIGTPENMSSDATETFKQTPTLTAAAMDKTATLDRLKAVEREIREAKQKAAEAKDQVLRNARKEALEILEAAKRDAEAEYEAYLRSVEEAAAEDREAILAKGRQEAEEIRARAQQRLDRAVAHLVRKFEDGVLHAAAQGNE